MKKFRFIFLRLCVYLIAGILCAFYFPIDALLLWVLLSIISAFFFISYFVSRRQIFNNLLPGLAAFLLIFILGYSAAYFSMPVNQPGHYINHNDGFGNTALVQGVISEELKPNTYSMRFIIELEKILDNGISKPVNGKVLLNIQKDSLHQNTLSPGTRLLIPWSPEPIKSPLNPFQFNYSKFMHNIKVERQINVLPIQISAINEDKFNIQAKAWQIRESLIDNLRELNFGKNELAVLQALILGQRREINDELYQNYAAAGAIHILAISGLHIGILLLFLNFLLKPVEKFRLGKTGKTILLIILLWSFAFLTGLSPSVVRAVCMFSFLAVGLQLKRKTSTLNSLFLSLFFLLLVNPYYVFQVGFQLSYLAVISIIIFQPLIYKIFTVKRRIPDYFWKLISASIAAQIGVLPLSLYYFHQFPGLFLVSNIVILPVLGFILGIGLAVIILAFVGLLPDVLASMLNSILRLLNQFVKMIAELDSFLFSNINFSLFQTLACYLLLLSLIVLIEKASFKRFLFFLSGIIIFQFATVYKSFSISDSEAIIFHKNRESVIGIRHDKKLTILSEDSLQNKFLEDYKRENSIRKIEISPIPQIFSVENEMILIVDTVMNYQINNFYPDKLFLRDNARINLDRLLSFYTPKEIIADGSNSYYMLRNWETTAKKKKIPFHYTGEKGAYIFSKK